MYSNLIVGFLQDFARETEQRPEILLSSCAASACRVMGEPTNIRTSRAGRAAPLLDEVANSRSTIVVTKHGKPVAKLVPINDEPAPTRGSVTLLVEDDEAYFSAEATWHAER